MEAVVSFLQPVGEERRAALSGDDAENMAQLREVRDLLLDALRECRENPVVDEGDGDRPKLSDRMRQHARWWLRLCRQRCAGPAKRLRARLHAVTNGCAVIITIY